MHCQEGIGIPFPCQVYLPEFFSIIRKRQLIYSVHNSVEFQGNTFNLLRAFQINQDPAARFFRRRIPEGIETTIRDIFSRMLFVGAAAKDRPVKADIT